MAQAIAPKETEYNRVVYKSRTEARLAVCFDSWGWTHEYEPKGDNTAPDFLAVMEPDGSETLPCRLPLLIECKPSEPTNEYMQDLGNRFRNISIKLNHPVEEASYRIVLPFRYFVFCCNFYQKRYSVLEFDHEHFQPHSCHEFLDFSAGESYRFDLSSERYTASDDWEEDAPWGSLVAPPKRRDPPTEIRDPPTVHEVLDHAKETGYPISFVRSWYSKKQGEGWRITDWKKSLQISHLIHTKRIANG